MVEVGNGIKGVILPDRRDAYHYAGIKVPHLINK